MTMRNKYAAGPVLQGHIAGFFARKELEGLPAYLDSLSHADFRRAGLLLEVQVLPSVPEEDFWHAFLILLQYHPKAMLVTMLKAAVGRMRRGKLSLEHPGFVRVANYLNENHLGMDKQKIIFHLLPVADNPEKAQYLLKSLEVDDPRERIEHLLRHSSLPVAYLLFLEFRRLEHDKAFLMRCCRYLMKRGDALSFNLASAAKAYFDLHALSGTFSLRLRPYELSMLENSYAGFCSVMSRI